MPATSRTALAIALVLAGGLFALVWLALLEGAALACLSDARDMGSPDESALCQARGAGPVPTVLLLGSPLVLAVGGVLAVVRANPRLLAASVGLAGLMLIAVAVPLVMT